MVWLCVEYDGKEFVSTSKPRKMNNYYLGSGIKLPNGSIKKLIGKELTWNDTPIELKND